MHAALVLAALVSGAAPKPARPSKAAPPPSAKLADAKPGDFVEYEVAVGAGRSGPAVTLRLEAVDVTAEAAVIDVRARGDRPPAWLARGVRLRVALTGRLPDEERPFTESTRDDTKPEARTRAGRSFSCRAWGVSTFDGPKGGGCRESPARELALGDGLVEEQLENTGWGQAEGHRITLSAFGHVEPGSADAGAAPSQRWADGTLLSVRTGPSEVVQESLRAVGGRWLVSHAELRALQKAPPGLGRFEPKDWETGRPRELQRTALEQLVALLELERRGVGLWPCDWCEPH